MHNLLCHYMVILLFTNAVGDCTLLDKMMENVLGVQCYNTVLAW